ncbi:hypothetical protein [Streptomyces iranensis]|uniref:Uncharacterized protein n=1 Tax=Streptomyces iranensis TaxID=576784 RepID=A0A060ZYU3_9ACTN|nr:hypothetical protein [Streptomyces iranensis]MBP2064624.1 hypothetical protein [Streptomyces iranensis]CDR12676.1 predicted protein [Streptomyces iranensis]
MSAAPIAVSASARPWTSRASGRALLAAQVQELEEALGGHQRGLGVGQVLVVEGAALGKDREGGGGQVRVAAQGTQQFPAIGQGGGQGVEKSGSTSTERSSAYGLQEQSPGVPGAVVGGGPGGEFGFGVFGVVLLGQHAQQSGRRCVGELAHQRCATALGDQPPPDGAGAQIGEADQLHRA